MSRCLDALPLLLFAEKLHAFACLPHAKVRSFLVAVANPVLEHLPTNRPTHRYPQPMPVRKRLETRQLFMMQRTPW